MQKVKHEFGNNDELLNGMVGNYDVYSTSKLPHVDGAITRNIRHYFPRSAPARSKQKNGFVLHTDTGTIVNVDFELWEKRRTVVYVGVQKIQRVNLIYHNTFFIINLNNKQKNKFHLTSLY